MSDLFFIIRMMVLTVVIVLIMQIKIGPSTLEQHSADWIHNSSVVSSLRLVSDGAVKALTQTYKSVAAILDTNIGKVFRKDEMPGSRHAAFQLKRSEQYFKNEEAKQAAAAATAVDEASQVNEK